MKMKATKDQTFPPFAKARHPYAQAIAAPLRALLGTKWAYLRPIHSITIFSTNPRTLNVVDSVAFL